MPRQGSVPGLPPGSGLGFSRVWFRVEGLGYTRVGFGGKYGSVWRGLHRSYIIEGLKESHVGVYDHHAM